MTVEQAVPVVVPAEVRRERLRGECPVQVTTDASGAVTALHFERSCPSTFRMPTAEAVWQWRFSGAGERREVVRFTAEQGTTVCRIHLQQPGDFELCEAVVVGELGDLPSTREVSVSPSGTLRVRSAAPVVAHIDRMDWPLPSGPARACPVLFEIEEDGSLLDARPQAPCPEWAMASVRDSARTWSFEPTGTFEVTTLTLRVDPRGPDWRPIAAGAAAAALSVGMVAALTR